MKYLVTGGLGFIGQHLVKKIIEDGDDQIVIIDNLTEQIHGVNPDYSELTGHPSITFYENDICDGSVVEKALKEVDIIIHLAAETGTGQSMYSINDYFRTNVLGTATLLEELIKMSASRPKKLILASSRSVYGEGAYVKASQQSDENAQRYYPTCRNSADMKSGEFDFHKDDELLAPVPTREDDPTDPQSLYAVTKLTQEQMCDVACKSVGVDFTALRFQNVYGPGQSLRNPYTGIISIFINILRQNGIVDIFEDGEETRDFIFVDDIVSALISTCILGIQEDIIINVGTGVGTSVFELVCMLERELGVSDKKEISGRFRVGDIRHNFADISRLNKNFSLGLPTALEDGLSKTVSWALTQPVEEDRTKAATEELARLQVE